MWDYGDSSAEQTPNNLLHKFQKFFFWSIFISQLLFPMLFPFTSPKVFSNYHHLHLLLLEDTVSKAYQPHSRCLFCLWYHFNIIIMLKCIARQKTETFIITKNKQTKTHAKTEQMPWVAMASVSPKKCTVTTALYIEGLCSVTVHEICWNVSHS